MRPNSNQHDEVDAEEQHEVEQHKVEADDHVIT
jgi:hypothetical protein